MDRETAGQIRVRATNLKGRHYSTLVTDLLAPDRVIARLNVNSKRRALQKLAEKASLAIGRPEAPIAAALQARERLGSTGIGNGVAIPHARLPDLHELFGLFARLDHPIDFAAVDNQPVDLVFLVLAPASNVNQLGALSLALRLLQDENVCGGLRNAPDPGSLLSLLIDADPNAKDLPPHLTEHQFAPGSRDPARIFRPIVSAVRMRF